ncbi:MAG TPA: hypothetical protein VJG29_01915 [Candidatus Paceibacterota bacterium]
MSSPDVADLEWLLKRDGAWVSETLNIIKHHMDVELLRVRTDLPEALVDLFLLLDYASNYFDENSDIETIGKIQDLVRHLAHTVLPVLDARATQAQEREKELLGMALRKLRGEILFLSATLCVRVTRLTREEAAQMKKRLN